MFGRPQHQSTKEVVLLYDIHRGKSHYRHLRGQEEPYEFVNEDKLLDDFLRKGEDSTGSLEAGRSRRSYSQGARALL